MLPMLEWSIVGGLDEAAHFTCVGGGARPCWRHRAGICGGRGTGAVENALGIKNGAIKLTAMADVFPQKLSDSHGRLRGRFASQMDVPQERRFVGFDGYQKAMNCLRPGDIAILTTPLAFRGLHFKYAIDKNLNVFMEKPVAVDGTGHGCLTSPP